MFLKVAWLANISTTQPNNPHPTTGSLTHARLLHRNNTYFTSNPQYAVIYVHSATLTPQYSAKQGTPSSPYYYPPSTVVTQKNPAPLSGLDQLRNDWLSPCKSRQLEKTNASVCPKVSESVRTCPKMSKCVQTCLNMSGKVSKSALMLLGVSECVFRCIQEW